MFTVDELLVLIEGENKEEIMDIILKDITLRDYLEPDQMEILAAKVRGRFSDSNLNESYKKFSCALSTLALEKKRNKSQGIVIDLT